MASLSGPLKGVTGLIFDLASLAEYMYTILLV